MSFDISIRVDPKDSAATIGKVEQALDKAEKKGTATGQAIGKGMREGSSAADKAKGSIDALTRSFDVMRNVASLAGPLMAAGAAAFALDKNYGDMANSAARFVDKTHSLNQTLDTQLALSKSLRSNLGETMEFYDAVRDGTDGLNMSFEDQIALTKTLGASMRLDNKTLAEAGGLMNTLSYAFANGAITGRELKGVFKQSADIAEIMTTGFGKTRAELVKMAEDGTLSLDKFSRVLIEAADSSVEKLDSRVKTLSQSLSEFKDEAMLAVGASIDFKTVGVELGKVLLDEEMALRRVSPEVDKFVTGLAKLSGETEKMTVAQYDAMRSIDAVTGAFQRQANAITNIADRIKAAKAKSATAMGNDALAEMTAITKKWTDAAIAKRGKAGRGSRKPEAEESLEGETVKSLLGDLDGGTRASGDGSNLFTDWRTAIDDGLEAQQRMTDGWNQSVESFKLNQSDMAKAWDSTVAQMTDSAGALEALLSNAFKGIEDSIVTLVTTGKFEWKSMVESMLADLTRLMVRKAMTALIGAIGGGGGGFASFYGTGATQAFEGQYGGAHASGGSFMVGGSGGTDSTLVGLHATPGERVTIETPSQQRSSDGGAGGSGVTHIHNHYSDDRRAITGAMSGRDGDKVIYNFVRRNPGLLKR